MKYIIRGGNRLSGQVKISGAKNSALKLMAAAIMAKGKTLLKNVPMIDDVLTMAEVLQLLGAQVNIDKANNSIEIDPDNIESFEAPYELVKKMRASILVAGPLLSRFGEVRIAIPGGCNIGSRQIDMHLKGFEQMGASYSNEHGYIHIKTTGLRTKKLKGAEINLDFPSRGATENILMAAVLASGTTIINNAAKEPETGDLARYLISCGADISGIDTECLIVNGVEELKGCEYEVMPDSIEAGTFIIAAALCGKKVEVIDAIWDDMGIFCSKLSETGVNLRNIENKAIIVKKTRALFKSTHISTLPFPGFPTDLQPIISVFLSLVPGVSIITENVFENRFMYIDELNRMGANIRIDGHHAVITGVPKLSGAPVAATDLRAGAALVLAGLAAEGVTEINDIHHIKRGYEDFDLKLRKLGADITQTD